MSAASRARDAVTAVPSVCSVNHRSPASPQPARPPRRTAVPGGWPQVPEPSCCAASAHPRLALAAPGASPSGRAPTPSAPCMGTGLSHGDSTAPGQSRQSVGKAPELGCHSPCSREEADTARGCSLSPASARACPRVEQAWGSEHTVTACFHGGAHFPAIINV